MRLVTGNTGAKFALMLGSEHRSDGSSQVLTMRTKHVSVSTFDGVMVNRGRHSISTLYSCFSDGSRTNSDSAHKISRVRR